MKKDEQYIKEKFSNKKTLFKGEAIVLLKLARQVEKEKFIKMIDIRIKNYKELHKKLPELNSLAKWEAMVELRESLK